MVDKSECIEHTQIGHNGGYGHKAFNKGGIRKRVNLHRWVYCVAAGVTLDSIDGLVVRHKCDNRRCINPEHLETGTHKDNARDRDSRGRNGVYLQSGELSVKAILTEDIVLEMRRRYVPYCRINGTAAMGREFGVDHKTVHKVLSRKTWRCVC